MWNNFQNSTTLALRSCWQENSINLFFLISDSWKGKLQNVTLPILSQSMHFALWRSNGNRTVNMQSSVIFTTSAHKLHDRPTRTVRCPCGSSTESVRWLCHPHVIMCIFVPNSLDHNQAWCFVRFYDHCIMVSCGSLAGSLPLPLEPTIILGPKWLYKILRCPHDQLAVPVQWSCDASYDMSTGLQFFKNGHGAELNKIVEARMPVNPFNDRRPSPCGGFMERWFGNHTGIVNSCEGKMYPRHKVHEKYVCISFKQIYDLKWKLPWNQSILVLNRQFGNSKQTKELTRSGLQARLSVYPPPPPQYWYFSPFFPRKH